MHARIGIRFTLKEDRGQYLGLFIRVRQRLEDADMEVLRGPHAHFHDVVRPGNNLTKMENQIGRNFSVGIH